MSLIIFLTNFYWIWWEFILIVGSWALTIFIRFFSSCSFVLMSSGKKANTFNSRKPFGSWWLPKKNSSNLKDSSATTLANSKLSTAKASLLLKIKLDFFSYSHYHLFYFFASTLKFTSIFFYPLTLSLFHLNSCFFPLNLYFILHESYQLINKCIKYKIIS